MMYDSLLLNYGGGIISSGQKSDQYAGAAAVAIGIGGTGVAALAELKRKVYQQLIPDNPGEPHPRYDHIQFLAIDADETVLSKLTGDARLEKNSEFFSIYNPTLKAMLKGPGKEKICGDPVFNWMEIENIHKLLSPEGAGGVRQIGRYLLLSKASALKTKILEKCSTALRGLASPSLDIYLFAGISGGTGSGCFLDTCYIIRAVLEEQGWDASSKLMGFFFLPDVVTSISDVASDPPKVAYNNSNGYAAMKELDYLMDLPSANDFFRQNYGAFQVNTQEPPVDLCHLISATKSDGTLINNAFSYSINVAADYVIAYLAAVNLGGITPGANDGGLTMRGHLTNVSQGVAALPRKHGANLSYHVLGAANAEMPMTQIATYLAAGFYRRFQQVVGREKVVLTKDAVNRFAEEMDLTANSVYGNVTWGSDSLFLPEIELKDLAAYGTMPKGKAPQPWSTPGNAWLDACSGKRAANRSALTAPLDTFDFEKVPGDSLTGRVFRKLYELSMDPDYGPYYAAGLLSHGGDDLMSALDGAIRQANEEYRTQLLYLHGRDNSGGMEDTLVQCSADFCHKKNKKNYAKYKQAAEQYFIILNRAREYNETADTLRTAKENLKQLYDTYFVPLLALLDNLKYTFQQDISYLSGTGAAATGYTTRILEFSVIRPRLDKSIDALAVNQFVNKFMHHILSGYDQWLSGGDSTIGKFISDYMGGVFTAELNRSLQDYFFEKYPDVKPDDEDGLAKAIMNNDIQKIHQSALPMFWCNPTFNLTDKDSAFQSSSLSVPRSTSAVCNAADEFKKNAHPEYTVRKTSLNDRLFALRFFSGIPLYAYQGITLLKNDYDKAAGTSAGIGSHLYANTGRGTDGSGNKDWRFFLPLPAPYSAQSNMFPNSGELLALYDAGERAGIIAQKDKLSYVILQTDPLNVPTYSLDAFLDESQVFLRGRLDEARRHLTSQLYNLHKPGMGQKEILLKNDGMMEMDENGNAAEGEIKVRVRKDYFLHYPKLQAVVRTELEKRATLQAGIDALNAIEAEYDGYTSDLETFCNLLFYGILPCTDGMNKSVFDPGPDGAVKMRKIDRIIYSYRDNQGMPVQQVFSRNGDPELKHIQDYPLYQAFLTYRNLPANALPRMEMDKAAADRNAQTLKAGDNVIGFILERTWDQQALEQLQQQVSSLSQEMRQDLMRFHLGLIKCIENFRNRFGGNHAAWTYLPSASPKFWTLYDNGRYLYVYENNNQNCGWDPDTSQWVPITAGMLVWNQASNSWLPVTGPDGVIHLP